MSDDKGIDITPKQDGGVLKKILREGIGNDLPSTGCKVQVHYVGKFLDGSVFDSSRDRGQHFEFFLGRREVIKAWDIGVASMKKGELALLTCAPQYAYGEGGSPPKIPPNSILEFEVEVIDWKGEDLSPKKDGSIERYTITPGKGPSKPHPGGLVEIHLIGTYNGEKFEERDESFNLGDGGRLGIVEGVEKALEKFKEGETSRLVIAPKYAFKNEGNKAFNIPPEATVEYTVTLKNFEKAKESWALDPKGRIEQAKSLKEIGTNYVKQNKYESAIDSYKKMFSYLDTDKNPEGEFANEQKDLQLSASLNLALCYLKQEQYLEARNECNKALKLNPANVKALFRRGQANLELSEPELALNDFNKVLEIEPSNKAAQAQIVASKRRILEHKSKEKQIYANMFAKFAKHDTEKEEEQRRKEPDVMKTLGEWGEDERERAPSNFEKENPNILMLDDSGEFKNM